ncbi:peptidylprolyl isomerase, partial [Parabacteroides merdae]
LFTRVLPEFMIQGGAPDSRNAPAGARCGFGDRNSEIMPEIRPHHFNKRGALAAPRQNDDINPQKKSDMSQFYIVQGKVYTSGELDTLEMIANQDIKEKAMQKFFYPVRAELRMQKASNKREYQKRLRKINAQVDSMIRATPGHLLFTKEQRKAYTTEGGCHHLDGNYTVYGELIEGFDVLDIIAGQPRDEYDRPKKDIRIIQLTIEN